MDTSPQKLKVLISTQYPLGGNYGGLLQAYALQLVIGRLGFDVATINSTQQFSLLPRYARYAAYLLYRVFGRNRPLPLGSSQADSLWKYTIEFLDSYMNTFDLFALRPAEQRQTVKELHAIVVGSDQVWRKRYANIPRQLLAYSPPGGPKKLSYAASFGKAGLTGYSSRLARRSAHWAGDFEAISVREKSGVATCSESWGVRAEQHVDPTLLVSRDEYATLINSKRAVLSPPAGDLFAYVLDPNEDVMSVIRQVESRLGLQQFELLPEQPSSYRRLKAEPERFRLRPVEEWLQAFADSKFVVTDSFHGTVFSIIFNKPFLVVGNQERGMSRFDSLLETFSLESRLVGSKDGNSLDLSEIDWSSINERIEVERARSLNFLQTHLLGDDH